LSETEGEHTRRVTVWVGVAVVIVVLLAALADFGLLWADATRIAAAAPASRDDVTVVSVRPADWSPGSASFIVTVKPSSPSAGSRTGTVFLAIKRQWGGGQMVLSGGPVDWAE